MLFFRRSVHRKCMGEPMKSAAAFVILGAVCISHLAYGQTAQPSPAPSAVNPAATSTSSPSPQKKVGWREGDNCVQNTKHEIDVELKSGEHPVGSELLSSTYFLPAEAPVDVLIREAYKEGVHYFAYIEDVNDPNVHAQLGHGAVSSAQVPNDHSLVKKGLAQRGDTMLTLAIPDAIGGYWSPAKLYVYSCAPTGRPLNVSELTVRVTSAETALVVWPIVLVIYILGALAARATDYEKVRWYRYLDPVYMTAGVDGKGSLSKLQILFFSIIIFGLLSYIVVRTGVLSDLSSSILLLMGIAGVGSATAAATDAQKNRLDFENWTWLVKKGWLPAGGWSAVNNACWHDIVTSDGEFDVYRFQSCIFSLTVGVALLAGGINELSTFTIPQTLLGILGLSQAVYIGGKMVSVTSVGQLNDATTALRGLEKKFRAAAASNPDPNPQLGGTPLQAAIRRAGAEYNDYIDKADGARLLFQWLTGRVVEDSNLTPAI
jgi:hypothetical protein